MAGCNYKGQGDSWEKTNFTHWLWQASWVLNLILILYRSKINASQMTVLVKCDVLGRNCNCYDKRMFKFYEYASQKILLDGNFFWVKSSHFILNKFILSSLSTIYLSKSVQFLLRLFAVIIQIFKSTRYLF